ncbi:hypothetical protein FGO68_gene1071 [Halteria grandinella]|uniref:Response regulator n=1 Tax=Halteria grandinella TaxID=5974 RepID=A0A8J8P2Y7_HALGN|nr:hypothetical protein FGO68_gene1071 [Halteria grandinella]
MRYRELNQEGVGLGLTISKNLALALGGDISVESKVGEGTTFSVYIPAINIRAQVPLLLSTPSQRIQSSFRHINLNESTLVIEMMRVENFNLLKNLYLKESDRLATNLGEIKLSQQDSKSTLNLQNRGKKAHSIKIKQSFSEDRVKEQQSISDEEYCDNFRGLKKDRRSGKKRPNIRQSAFSSQNDRGDSSNRSMRSSRQFGESDGQQPQSICLTSRKEKKFFNKNRERYPFRALLVDDEPFNLMVLDGFLHMIIPDTDIILEVFQAMNGQRALEIIHEQFSKGHPIDAIFTDQKMPVMGGSALAKIIRQQEQKGEIENKIPIILVSGEVLYPKMNDYILNGQVVKLFDHALLKPFTVDHLKDIVSLILAQQ